MSCFLSVATVKLAEENKDFVIGFICQNKLSEDPQMLHLTPGGFFFRPHYFKEFMQYKLTAIFHGCKK